MIDVVLLFYILVGVFVIVGMSTMCYFMGITCLYFGFEEEEFNLEARYYNPYLLDSPRDIKDARRLMEEYDNEWH